MICVLGILNDITSIFEKFQNFFENNQETPTGSEVSEETVQTAEINETNEITPKEQENESEVKQTKESLTTKLKKYAPYIIGGIFIVAAGYVGYHFFCNSGNDGGGGGPDFPPSENILSERSTEMTEIRLIPELPLNFVDLREGFPPGSRKAMVSILKYLQVFTAREDIDQIASIGRYEYALWKNTDIGDYESKEDLDEPLIPENYDLDSLDDEQIIALMKKLPLWDFWENIDKFR